MRVAMVVLLVACAGVLAVSVPRQRPASVMVAAANNFLAALSEEQRASAVIPFDNEERLNWHFVPRDRKGVPLKKLNAAQQHLAHAFLSAGLSQRGYLKATTIMSLEQILLELEKGSGPVRDPELYYFSVFGEPADNATWGWRVEGHHISLNFTVVRGELIATSPTFLGSNPAEVKQGPRKGLRVLQREEDLARELLGALDEKQRAVAVVDATAPRDILSTNVRKASPLEAKGLVAAKMTARQREILLRLLEEYAGNMPPELAEERMQKVRKAGLEKLVFAWAGPAERGQGHYYRVQGPTFLVEYDNTQNNANHIHTVWRDFDGDFGADLLADHYKNSPHHRR